MKSVLCDSLYWIAIAKPGDPVGRRNHQTAGGLPESCGPAGRANDPDYGGAFVADVVGLGKGYIGAAIVKHFERTDHARSLIVCPAPLTEMWERYNEVYQLNARVLSMVT